MIIDPDYARIYTQARVIAWQYGFAVSVHGSTTRDLDLLMVPWEERASDSVIEPVVNRICQICELEKSPNGWQEKPHGRRAHSLLLKDFTRWVDLSVMPCKIVG